ncbi:hypothetical protein OAH89_00735 [Flavobacteriaceae bacterium]|nr:hypothetical protein [Flavobacteriaceae bacterium]
MRNHKSVGFNYTYILLYLTINGIIYESNGNQTVNENEIYDIKARKFSILKLATGIVGTYGAFVVIGVLALLSFAL